MKINFLGTSDSAGIPVHNCDCFICTEYRNKKKNNGSTCAYIKNKKNEVILLDAGAENIVSLFDGQKIRAIFLTHFHADHVSGLLRLRYSHDTIECYHPHDEQGFADLFKHKHSIVYHENTPFKKIQIDEITFTPIPLQHSKNTTGYLIEDETSAIAYLTDCAGISQKALDFLKSKSLDECYLDAALFPPATKQPEQQNQNQNKKTNHLDFLQAEKILDILSPQKGYLIHAGHVTLKKIHENNIELKYPYLLL